MCCAFAESAVCTSQLVFQFFSLLSFFIVWFRPESANCTRVVRKSGGRVVRNFLKVQCSASFRICNCSELCSAFAGQSALRNLCFNFVLLLYFIVCNRLKSAILQAGSARLFGGLCGELCVDLVAGSEAEPSLLLLERFGYCRVLSALRN